MPLNSAWIGALTRRDSVPAKEPWFRPPETRLCHSPPATQPAALLAHGARPRREIMCSTMPKSSPAPARPPALTLHSHCTPVIFPYRLHASAYRNLCPHVTLHVSTTCSIRHPCPASRMGLPRSPRRHWGALPCRLSRLPPAVMNSSTVVPASLLVALSLSCSPLDHL